MMQSFYDPNVYFFTTSFYDPNVYFSQHQVQNAGRCQQVSNAYDIVISSACDNYADYEVRTILRLNSNDYNDYELRNSTETGQRELH